MGTPDFAFDIFLRLEIVIGKIRCPRWRMPMVGEIMWRMHELQVLLKILGVMIEDDVAIRKPDTHQEVFLVF